MHPITKEGESYACNCCDVTLVYKGHSDEGVIPHEVWGCPECDALYSVDKYNIEEM